MLFEVMRTMKNRTPRKEKSQRVQFKVEELSHRIMLSGDGVGSPVYPPPPPTTAMIEPGEGTIGP
jgi:hypothetical protein